MAIIIKTGNPKELQESFVKAIRDRKILTWIVDDDGDFTVRRELWRNHAWMRCYSINEGLAFGIVESKKYPLTKDLYGIMHGRLVVTLLTNFDSLISRIEVSSQLEDKYDIYVKR